jgi:hypothetical protein
MSVRHAFDAYGVVLHPESLALNEPATLHTRLSRRSAS